MSPGLSGGVTADSFSPLKTLHVSLFRLKTACLMCRVSSRTGDLTLHSDTRWSEASGRSYMEANWQTQDQSVLSIRRNCGTLAPGCQPVSSLCVCVMLTVNVCVEVLRLMTPFWLIITDTRVEVVWEKKCSDAFTVTACVRDLKASVVPVSPAGLLMKLQEVLLLCGLPDNLFLFCLTYN